MPKYRSITDWKLGKDRIGPGTIVELEQDRGEALIARGLVVEVAAKGGGAPPKVETATTTDPAEENATDPKGKKPPAKKTAEG